MKVKIIFSIILLIFQTSRSQKNNIYGKYQNCPFACVTVTIDSNNIFEYRLTGDLFTGEGCFGNLTQISNNEYIANSNEQPVTIIDELNSKSNRFSYVYIQFYQDTVSSGLIPFEIQCKDTVYNGHLFGADLFKFNKSQIINIKINNQSEINYFIKNSKADSICIQIPNYLGKVYITNEKWLFENDNLYLWNEQDEEYNMEFPLQKINSP